MAGSSEERAFACSWSSPCGVGACAASILHKSVSLPSVPRRKISSPLWQLLLGGTSLECCRGSDEKERVPR